MTKAGTPPVDPATPYQPRESTLRPRSGRFDTAGEVSFAIERVPSGGTRVEHMKRWIAGVAAVGLIVGIGGPVAAKVGNPSRGAKSATVSAPAKSSPKPAAKGADAGVFAGQSSVYTGSYPGPNQPKVEVEPKDPRRGRDFRVEVKYFCRRGSVSVGIAPSLPDWPKSITTDRYGNGYVRVRRGISTSGNYTITATCGADTATVNFRVR